MIRQTLYVLLLFLAALNVRAQKFTLQEAQDFAVKNNHQVKQAAYSLDASRQTVKSYTSIGLPQIQATGSFQDYINIPTSVVPADAFGFPDWFTQWVQQVSMQTGTMPNIPQSQGEYTELQFGSKYSMTGGLSASQLLFDGSYFIGLKAAKTYVEVTTAALSKTENEIRAMVAQTYNMALIADENIKILTESKENVSETYRQTKAMYEAGFVEEMDVERLELMIAGLETSLSNARNQRLVAYALLRFQMGTDPAAELELTDKIDDLVAKAESTALVKQFNPETHIDMAVAGSQVKLMSLNHKVEKSKQYPRLTAFFNHQYNAYRNEFDYFEGGKWFPATLWGLNLNMPLFTSFYTRSNIQKARIEYEKAISQQSMIEHSLRLQYATASSDFNSALERFNTEKRNLALAEKIKSKSLIKYNEGVGSSIELNMAETQLISTRGNYIQSLFALLNAKAALDKINATK